MSATQDFTSFELVSIDNFIRSNLLEFQDTLDGYDGLVATDKIVALPRGFAIVRANSYGLILTYLYSGQRRKGVGSRLIELVKEIDSTKDLWLVCYGDQRRDWFVKNGFSVDPSTGEGYRMVMRGIAP